MAAYEKLKLTQKQDGTFSRHVFNPRVAPTNIGSATSKDVVINKSRNTFVRIFRPFTLWKTLRPQPLILYIHGGCFVHYSAANPVFHMACQQLAAELPATVLSIEHRLAPEHRLPAAYDDAVDALLWLRDQARELTEMSLDLADFSKCFVMGNGSGGNIAFHMAIRALELDLSPINLSGLILHQANFGGEERTESELNMANDPLAMTDLANELVAPPEETTSGWYARFMIDIKLNYPTLVAACLKQLRDFRSDEMTESQLRMANKMVSALEITDLAYKLALPEGANRDHEYINPMKLRSKVRGLPRCLISGYLKDLLIDRQRMLAEMLEEEGVSVVKKIDREGFHGNDMVHSDKANALVADVKHFVFEDGC